MSVNLDRLDCLENYGLEIAAIDGFVAELVAEFMTSIEGQVYLAAYSTTTKYVGSWIERLVYFGYVGRSVTLPQMAVDDVEVIVTQIFPQQISWLNSIEADTTIAELAAFWQFLLRQYQHSQAVEIIGFLARLQPQFTEIVNDAREVSTTRSVPSLNSAFESKIIPRGDRNSEWLLDSLFDNLAASQSKLPPSNEQRELETTLRELAAEILREFPQEVPSARELQQQVQPDLTQLVESAPSTSSLELISLELEVSELPTAKFTAGVYIFKVSWHQIWRRIAISSNMTLWDLSQSILRSLDFESNQLDLFSYQNSSGKTIQISHPDLDDSLSTEKVKIGALSLDVGSTIEYLFDFEDNWEFQLELEEIRSDDLRLNYVETLESQGKAPEQYPDWLEY